LAAAARAGVSQRRLGGLGVLGENSGSNHPVVFNRRYATGWCCVAHSRGLKSTSTLVCRYATLIRASSPHLKTFSPHRPTKAPLRSVENLAKKFPCRGSSGFSRRLCGPDSPTPRGRGGLGEEAISRWGPSRRGRRRSRWRGGGRRCGVRAGAWRRRRAGLVRRGRDRRAWAWRRGRSGAVRCGRRGR
jgi:hypothetical protein